MIVICENIKQCKNFNKITCGHYTPHKHTLECDMRCHQISVNCTKMLLEKKK